MNPLIFRKVFNNKKERENIIDFKSIYTSNRDGIPPYHATQDIFILWNGKHDSRNIDGNHAAKIYDFAKYNGD